MQKPKVLSLQPYSGGSHLAFMNCWQSRSQLDWLTIELPPRHWKWRMRHSAWYMAARTNELWAQGERWQINFATDMLNVAEFKGLVRSEIASLPTIVYFHENQFVYPNQQALPRDLHFGITNFSSALAADSVWFNSQFNRDSMLQSVKALCGKWPDFPPVQQLDGVATKSRIVNPCIETPGSSRGSLAPDSQSPIHLVWASRWEHDKGPATLLEILKRLSTQETDFQLSVVGQSFRQVPKEFELIRSEFAEQIVAWGYQETRELYWKVLASADVFLSTAEHEFFGLAAVEAIAAGLYPVLPNRLAYPELVAVITEDVPETHLYDDIDSAINLLVSVKQNWEIFQRSLAAEKFNSRFSNLTRVRELDRQILQFID